MARARGASGNELDTPEPRDMRPVVRDYLIVCLAALLFLTLILQYEGYGWWSLLPLLVGVVGVVARWGAAPPLVLLVLMMMLLLRGMLTSVLLPLGDEPLAGLDLILAILTLVYLSSATRLLALLRHTVPPDVRRARRPPGSRVRGRWLLPREATSRSSPAIPSGEIVTLLVSVPPFALLAALLWIRLGVEPPPRWLELDPTLWPPTLWRLLLLVWGMGIALAGLHAFLAYLGRTQASAEQSLLYLQDQLWTQTRGEERRINRWVVWGRLRRQRKEEQR
jgi:hypothetical protein